MIVSAPGGTKGQDMPMLSRAPLSLAALAFALLGTACPAPDEPLDDTSSSGDSESSEPTTSDGSTGATTVDDASSSGSSDDAADSSGGAADPACDCVTGEEDLVEFVCDTEELCEPIVVSCSEAQPADCELADFTVLEPELLDCHHQALVAGTPGLLRWEAPLLTDPGAGGQRRWLIVQEDRRALTWHESWGVPSYDISDVEVVELRAAEHFDGCMALGSAEESFRCLFDAGENTVDVCIDAHSFEIG